MPIGGRNPTTPTPHHGVPGTQRGLQAASVAAADPAAAGPCSGCGGGQRINRTIFGVMTTLPDGTTVPVATLAAPAGGASYEIQRITVHLDATDTDEVQVAVGDTTQIADTIDAPTKDRYVSADAQPIWVPETEALLVVWVGATTAGPCRARLQIRVV